MDVNSKEAELWSETMKLKSSVEHKDAEIERLKAELKDAQEAIGVGAWAEASYVIFRALKGWEA